MPAVIPLATAHCVHDFVRGGIIGRERNFVGIVRFVKAAPRIRFKIEAGHNPVFVVEFFSDGGIGIAVGLFAPELSGAS